MSFGERIRELRESKGWTQEYVALKMNFSSNQVVSNYERNYRKPDPDTVRKIADFFGVSVDYLLGRTDDPEPYAVTAEDLAKGRRVKSPVNIEKEGPYHTLTEKSERDLLLEELEQYGNLAFEGGGEDLSDEELREIVQAMRDAAEDAAKRTLNLINRFKK